MKVTRRYEVKAVHGFRKFFRTYAEPKIGSLNAMTLMGQDTGLTASYNKPTVEMLLVEYMKAVDNLTIDKTRTKQQQQDEKMVDFATKQQALAVQLETKHQEIQGLRKQTQILTEAYKGMEERRESKDHEILELKDQMSQMMQTFESYHRLTKERMNQMDDSIGFLTNEITKYRRQFGPRPLTEKERNKIDIFRKQLENIPDDDMVTNE